jgi:hypothetical protein
VMHYAGVRMCLHGLCCRQTNLGILVRQGTAISLELESCKILLAHRKIENSDLAFILVSLIVLLTLHLC